MQAADQFKQSGGFIIVIAYQQTNQAPIPRICDLASPGMCFDNRNASVNLYSLITGALCVGEG
jgi:hypothetical protein